MKISRFLPAAVGVLVAVTAAGALEPSAAAPFSGSAGVAAAKKRCHFVKKKVRGKVRRVRVCTKPKPKPKNVAVALDRSSEAKATIGEHGGTVSTLRSDVKVTLSIPEGALATDTQVTLTPVTAVRGLPKKLKLVAGVQFAPEGLTLEKPATLTIQAPGTAQAHAIAWFGLGKDVSRYPSTRAGNSLTIRISHFSGAAAVAGPASAWNELPSTIAALRAWFTTVVQPGLAAAATADPLSSPTFDLAFAWERQVELLGLGGEFAAEKAKVRAALLKAIPAALDRAESRCKQNHDLTQVERLARLDRIAQLWGIDVGQSGFDRAGECAQFELDIEFHALLHGESSGQGAHLVEDGDLVVAARGLHIDLNPTLGGSARPSVEKWVFTYSAQIGDLSCSGQQTAATVTKDVAVALVVDPVGVAIRGYPEISLLVDPGEVDPTVTVTCSNGGSSTEKVLEYGSLFRAAFADRAQPDGRIRFDILPPLGHYVGGSTWATYGPESRQFEYAWVYGKVAGTDTVKFTLRHTPAP